MQEETYGPAIAGTSKNCIGAVKELLTRAKNEQLTFDILGYQDSEGKVHDYLGLMCVGHDGYQALVRLAIAWAEKRKTYIPGWCGNPETWIAAVVQQRESWLTTLAGGHERKAQELEYAEEDAWATHKDKPDTLILKSLELTGEHKLYATEVPVKEPKSLEAKCKAFLRSNSPLQRFVGQLNLAPGKFAKIRIHGPHTPMVDATA